MNAIEVVDNLFCINLGQVYARLEMFCHLVLVFSLISWLEK